MHASSRVARDLLPLPLLGGQDLPKTNLSRGCRQRWLRRERRVDDCNAAIRALNYLNSPGSKNDAGPIHSLQTFRASAAQAEALLRIQTAVDHLGPPPDDVTVPEALRQLRCEGYVDDLQATGALASFNPEGVSLPEEGWKPISLASLGGRDGGVSVGDYVQQQVLPPELASARVEACGVKYPYTDPKLRDPKVYGAFLGRLARSNLVDFSTQAGAEHISLFFVRKKNGKLRMIIDARRSNQHFRDPDHVQLCTGDTLSRFEIDGEEDLTICQADLKDAFYHLSLPESLRKYFVLPPIDGRYLKGVCLPDGTPVGSGLKVFPRLAVVPMGWSWALFICQNLHEQIVEASGLSEGQRLRDGRPCPSAAVAHTQYVDNLVVLGQDRSAVVSAFQHAVEHLKAAGLQVHEEEICDGGACVLGWEFEASGIFRPSARRVWRARLAIRALLARRRASGKQIERLVGLCSFICLARRESLSVFGDVYQFITRYRDCGREIRMPPGVRRELHMWDAISPLIFKDLRSPWSEQVHRLGRYSERWRFAAHEVMALTVTNPLQILRWRRTPTLPVGEADPALFNLGGFAPKWRRSVSPLGYSCVYAGSPANGTRLTTQAGAFGSLVCRVALQKMFYRETLCAPASTVARTPQSSKKRMVSQMAPPALNVQSCLPTQEVEQRQTKKARRLASLAAQPAPVESLTRLELASVSTACRARYQRLWEGVAPLLCSSPGVLKDMSTVETILCQQLEELFLDGCNLASGQYLIAAVIFFNLSLKSHPMPRVKQSLQGWRKLAPPQARLPIPYEAVALMAQMAFAKGLISIGLFLLLAFALYLRPSEGLRLRKRDVIKPVQKRGTSSHWQFVLNPLEEGVPSKTQEFDETLQLDLKYHRGLGEAIHRCLGLDKLSSNQKIFQLESKDINDFMMLARVQLNLQPLGHLHLYRLRHGGASYDYNNHFRDLASVQQRGRWKSHNSVRRYQKGGRLAQLFAALSPETRRLATKAATGLQGTLLSLRCWPTLLWDIDLGAEYDLLLRKNQCKLVGDHRLWLCPPVRRVLRSAGGVDDPPLADEPGEAATPGGAALSSEQRASHPVPITNVVPLRIPTAAGALSEPKGSKVCMSADKLGPRVLTEGNVFSPYVLSRFAAMDGFGDALLGTVLLAQLPVQPPEVLFFVPGDDEEQDADAPDDEEGPEDEFEPESSRDDFSILRSRNMGAPVMSSAEDLNRHSLQYFGVPSTTLAKLMIPMSEGQICNQLTISEVDAGKFEYAHRHNTKENHDHLLFVSHPSGFAKIAATQLVQEQLCREEIQTGYVSWEVRRLKELIRMKSLGDHQADPEVVESEHPLERLIRDLYNRMKESGSQKLEVNGVDLYRSHDFPEDAVEVSELQGISLFRTIKDVDREFPPDTDSSRAAQHLIVKKKAKVVNVFRPLTRVALAQGIDTSKDSLLAQHFTEWRKKHDPERGRLSKKKERREQKDSKTTFTEALTLFHKGMEIQNVKKEFKDDAEYQMILGYLVAQGLVVQLGQFCHFMPHRARGRPSQSPPPNSHELRATHLWRAPTTFDPALHLKEHEFRVLESRTADPDVLHFFVEFILRIVRLHKRLDSVAFDELLREFGGIPMAAFASEVTAVSRSAGTGTVDPEQTPEQPAAMRPDEGTAVAAAGEPSGESGGAQQKWSVQWALELFDANKDIFVLYRSRS
ncbi:hypothetical protein AK812_SmicGene28692 [Symbiodinium microadriaticum]|uniref:Reverse transcriptase domain-containing protein n=1 Tax=Symbiodinium microadriaticum TaxID=2951 RepID=A0A1Q9D3P9_SYMMI|nr:hypothetical protein AK812_SmicGene28692 [Symbiodinium microadriaticum]